MGKTVPVSYSGKWELVIPWRLIPAHHAASRMYPRIPEQGSLHSANGAAFQLKDKLIAVGRSQQANLWFREAQGREQATHRQLRNAEQVERWPWDGNLGKRHYDLQLIWHKGNLGEEISQSRRNQPSLQQNARRWVEEARALDAKVLGELTAAKRTTQSIRKLAIKTHTAVRNWKGEEHKTFRFYWPLKTRKR